MAKKKKKLAAAMAATSSGTSEKELVQKAYEDAIYQNMVQCFANSVTDKQAVEHFLNGRNTYRATRDKLLASL